MNDWKSETKAAAEARRPKRRPGRPSEADREAEWWETWRFAAGLALADLGMLSPEQEAEVRAEYRRRFPFPDYDPAEAEADKQRVAELLHQTQNPSHGE